MNLHILNHDLEHCIERLPAEVLQVLKTHRCCVAGGYIRSTVKGETPKDIDIFVDSEATAHKIAAELRRPGAEIIETGKALTILGFSGPAPQVIFKWTFDGMSKVIDSFDFTIAQASFWWDRAGWDSRVSPNFYLDVRQNRLSFTSPKDNDTMGSLLRVLKFYRAGYAIDNDNLSEVLADAIWEAGATLHDDKKSLKIDILTRLPLRGDGKY